MMGSALDFLEVGIQLGLGEYILVGLLGLQFLVLLEHVNVLTEFVHKPGGSVLDEVVGGDQDVECFLGLLQVIVKLLELLEDESDDLIKGIHFICQ